MPQNAFAIRLSVFLLLSSGSLALAESAAPPAGVAAKAETDPLAAWQKLRESGEYKRALELALQQVETSGPLASRMEWVRRASTMALSRGYTRVIRDALDKLRQAQPNAAAPRLLLAQMYLSLNEETKAQGELHFSDLPNLPQEEWLNAARLQGEARRWNDARDSLGKAAALGQTPGLEIARAQWNLTAGDEVEAKRAFIALLQSGALAPLEDVRAFATSLCRLQEWGDAIRFLEVAAPRYPTDTALHYLQGMSLEEMGRDGDAAQAFGAALDTLGALPPSPALLGVYAWEENLPDQVREILLATPYAAAAYNYRTATRAFASDAFASEASERLYTESPELPRTQRQARSLILLHLAELSRLAAEPARREKIRAILKARGVARPELWEGVLWETSRGGTGLTAEAALTHPQDADWQALWLAAHVNNRRFVPDDLPALDRCVSLFEKTQPSLAFAAAQAAAGVVSAHFAQNQERALAAFHPLMNAPPDAYVVRTLGLSFIDHSPKTEAFQDNSIALLLRWLPQLPVDSPDNGQASYGQSRREIFVSELIRLLRYRGSYEDLLRVLEEEKSHTAPEGQIRRHLARNLSPPGQPSFLHAPLFPLQLLPWSPTLMEACRISESPGHLFIGGNTPEERRSDAALAEAAAQVSDPYLGWALQRFTQPEKVRAALHQRLAEPGATATDWLFAAWLISERQDAAEAPEVAQDLAHALTLPMENPQRWAAEEALLYVAATLPDPLPAPLKAAARSAALDRLRGPLSKDQADPMARTLDWLELKDAAQSLRQAEPLGKNESSRLAERGSAPYLEAAQQAQTAGRSADARAAALRALRLEAPTVLGNPYSVTPFNSLREVTKIAPVAQLLQTADPGPSGNARDHLTFACLCELTEQRDRAIPYYQQVVQDTRWRDLVQMRLLDYAIEEDDATGALAVLDQMAPTTYPRAGTLVWQKFSVMGRGQPWSRPICLKLAAKLIEKQNARSTHFSWFTTFGEQFVLSQNRNQPDAALFQAALKSLDLRSMALAVLGNQALQHGDDLGPLAEEAWRQWKTPVPGQGYLVNLVANDRTPSSLAQFYPSAPLLLICHAWQAHHPQDVDAMLDPALRPDLSPERQDLIRRAAALFFCPEAEFPKAAQSFCEATDTSIDLLGVPFQLSQAGGPVDLVTTVLRLRQLHVRLADFTADWVHRAQTSGEAVFPMPNGALAPLVRYLSLAPGFTDDDRLAVLRRVRDSLCGADAEQRRQALEKAVAEDKLRRDPGQSTASFKASLIGLTPRSKPFTGVDLYLQLLNDAAISPALLGPILALANEDHLTSQPNWAYGWWRSVSFSLLLDTDPKPLYRVMRASSMLEPAPTFRTWYLGKNFPGTAIELLLQSVKPQGRAQLAALLQDHLPRTFGAEFLQILIVGDVLRPSPLVPQFLKAHAAELAQIPTEHREEVAALLRRQIPAWDQPEKLDPELRTALAPFFAVEQTHADKKIETVLATHDVAYVKESAAAFQRDTLLHWRRQATLKPAGATRLAQQIIALLKEAAQSRAADFPSSTPPPSDAGRSEVSWWLSEACDTPEELWLIQPIAVQEGLWSQPAWNERAYANLVRKSITDGPSAISAFEKLRFLGDAAHFETHRLLGDQTWVATIGLLARNISFSWRKDFIAALKTRQPQTFGVALVLALEGNVPAVPAPPEESEPEVGPAPKSKASRRELPKTLTLSERLENFVKRQAGEFAELSPESAASVLAILREDAQLPTDPSTSSDAAWLKLLQPLADQEKRLAQEWRKRFMAATSLQALHLSAREFAEQAPTQLRALARYAPDQAELAFRHGLTLLNTAPSDATALRVWCNGSASAPPLIGPVFQALQQPEHAAILTEWTRDLALNLHLRTALQDPEYTIKLFQTLPFLADAAHFRGYTAPRLTFGTTLKTLTGYLSTPACKASRERLEKHLLSQPHRTFGVDVVLALLSKNSTAALAHTLLDHQAELPQLSAAAREDITQMLTHPPRRRQRLPLTPEEQKALEPFLPGA